jgi:hypothetical protein
MRTVSGLVPIAPEVDTQSQRAALPRPRIRWRWRGSSSSRTCPVPLRQLVRHPLRTLTRTRGLASRFRTQSERRPCWATSQKVSPSSPSQMGVRRGCSVRRPVVSRRASPGGPSPNLHASVRSGLTTDFCRGWRMRCWAVDLATSGPALPLEGPGSRVWTAGPEESATDRRPIPRFAAQEIPKRRLRGGSLLIQENLNSVDGDKRAWQGQQPGARTWHQRRGAACR